ncbi:MAG: phenylalanine--tRNA ligase subunit beta [Candidatus Bathyarchaeota archaeon]|nr:MAG: phenylalanine--tRNA ligase subunit beta [Candidatus Bathyarchaeota archaeon]
MPTINVLFSDLQHLIDNNMPPELNALNDILSFAKGEVESLTGDELSIEIKDGNRPDLWSVEGISRQIRGALGIDEGLQEYFIKDVSGIEVTVDPKLQTIRPYIACALIKNIHLIHEIMREFMHLQDKLDQTYGRRRKRASIGLYNYQLLEPPIHYSIAKPTEVNFTPLGSEKRMNLKEIVNIHPKGIEYGHIINEHEYWPILHDARKHVLSFPPIINSNTLGKITENVKDIFIEVTGTSYPTVLNTLLIVALSASDRGGDIFSTIIHYPYPKAPKNDVTPKLRTKKIDLNRAYINKVLGLDLENHTIINLLERARYGVSDSNSETIRVTVPCYRLDVMHQVDIIEDVAIVFGYNNIKPRWPQLITFGEINPSSSFANLARNIMIGLGFQEILTFSMSNLETLYNKMNCKANLVVEVNNPMSSRFNCVRNWLLPSLIEFLANNTHHSYPQKIFEVGECVVLNKNRTKVIESKKLACVTIHYNTNFSEIKAVLQAFFHNLGVTFHLKPVTHNSFIDGRIGSITVNKNQVGIIGEIHPQVIANWKLENPIAGLELDLNKIFSTRDS